MPRGEKYPEEVREAARLLRRNGWSLGEISQRLGIPKHTLSPWLRGIELTPQQRERLKQHEIDMTGRNRALAMEAHRQGRLDRIQVAKDKAEAVLSTISDRQLVNHVAAAMLYLGEGAKSEGAFAFANSNPEIIRYWLYLMRSSFDLDESKFRIRVICRHDQNVQELETYWTQLTGINHTIKASMDARTEGKPTNRTDYRGVCSIVYHDAALRRYLDALAHGLMAQAIDNGSTL